MAAPSSGAAHAPTVEQVSNEILETAKGLGITQQQERRKTPRQRYRRAVMVGKIATGGD